ncbi:MAG: diacylglycerol kinase family protein [Pirellulales bacterium]
MIISVNPKAGARARHDQVREIEEALVAGGYKVHTTTSLDEVGLRSAAMWSGKELRAVVAVGGDGTASLVRSHVPLEVPLLALPLGTENLLARYVGQSPDPTAVRRTLDEGVTIELDMGRAGDRYFLLMISAGFDAEVIRTLHKDRQGNITRLSYFLPTLRTIRGYGYPEMQLYCRDSAAGKVDSDVSSITPDGDGPLKCRWVFGFNLPLYALHIPIAPEAVGTDGQLDIVAFERSGVTSAVRYLWHAMRGSHGRLLDATLFRSRRFRLESGGVPDVAYQLDGDFAGTLPVDIEMLPGQLRLFVARETAKRLGFDISSSG